MTMTSYGRMRELHLLWSRRPRDDPVAGGRMQRCAEGTNGPEYSAYAAGANRAPNSPERQLVVLQGEQHPHAQPAIEVEGAGAGVGAQTCVRDTAGPGGRIGLGQQLLRHSPAPMRLGHGELRDPGLVRGVEHDGGADRLTLVGGDPEGRRVDVWPVEDVRPPVGERALRAALPLAEC